ncbi:MAG: DUF4351 domain-containing protein [Thiohalocapsa sp.]|jgi:hypothetical protein|uniref:hypothetical protein n=1 Tax=Thiohalocapsa sp. TaxID=2497641 RepID=UPI0025FCD0E8|nr:hypothetical protein [Thiohalocapsa sp.]MCG6943533.1 DUF4351 domain-containing protein [Thiohalocapsa sp.]
MSHDQDFKNLIVDYPHDAVQFFAADEAAEVDQRVRIIPVRQEQLKERLGDRFRELDVPLLLEWPDGRHAAVLFALEEETETSRFSIHRLAHYCLDLAELFETERVVPVAIFLRKGERPASLTLGGDRYDFLTFRYLACALKHLDWQDWRDSDNIVARLNLPNMRYAPSERVTVYALALRGLMQLEPDPEKRLKYADFVDIYANLSDTEREEYERDYPEEAKTMQSFSTRMREEGKEIGKQIGIQLGEANMLMLLLEDKFGPVPEQVRAQVEAANPESLLRWSRRLLKAESIDDVLR